MADHTFEKVVSTARTSPVLLGIVTAAAVGIAWTINDYLAWKAFGTGGTPPTWAGYWKMTKIRINHALSNDDLLDASVLSTSGPSYLPSSGLPTRSGPRPRIMARIMPQRQVPDKARLSPSSRARLHGLARTLAAQHPDLLETKPSHTEGKSTDGLYARKDSPDLKPNERVASATILDFEIAHAHPAEDSLHVWLSEADARKVVEADWGQRFPLAFVDKGWTLVYAPRNHDEIDVVETIVKAGVAWVTGVAI